MRIGDQFLLHKIPFPDQSDEEDTIISVVITEIKSGVHDMWTGEPKHVGYRAIGENDDMFELNWDSFPSDSMTPHWMWFNRTREESWYDIIYVKEIISKPIFLDRYPFVKYCEEHLILYYEDRTTGCFDCYMERTYGKDRSIKKPQNWQGWR